MPKRTAIVGQTAVIFNHSLSEYNGELFSMSYFPVVQRN